MIIGYTKDDYATRRFLKNIVSGVSYKKIWDVYSLSKLAIIPFNRILKKGYFNDLYLQFNDFNLNNTDLIHLFNTVSYGSKPWIMSYEHIVPHFNCMKRCHIGPQPSFSSLRNDRKFIKGLEALASNYCKKIIALSNCTANLERAMLNIFPEYKDVIENKLIIMHPPQKKLISNIDEKIFKFHGGINFIFIGHAFFNKGGVDLLETMIDLKFKYNYNILLNIISSIITDDYVSLSNKYDIIKVKNMIKMNSSWIKWFPKLPYESVLELCKLSHVGILPTYADSYGFSVLEMQASGCPVITTNVRALPEINNDEKGWIINIPVNHLGEAIHSTEADRQEISKNIKLQLEGIIHEIFADPSVILTKGSYSLKDIENNHSLNKYSQKMKEIYIESLNK